MANILQTNWVVIGKLRMCAKFFKTSSSETDIELINLQSSCHSTATSRLCWIKKARQISEFCIPWSEHCPFQFLPRKETFGGCGLCSTIDQTSEQICTDKDSKGLKRPLETRFQLLREDLTSSSWWSLRSMGDCWKVPLDPSALIKHFCCLLLSQTQPALWSAPLGQKFT